MKNFENLRKRLLAEKKVLEGELDEVGRRNPNVPGDWEAIPPETESGADADLNVVADNVEGFEEAVAVEGELEQRLFQVISALKRMENNTYGICLVCKKEIESDRLLANPAATTCIEHRNN